VLVDPQSVKNTIKSSVSFLGSASVKAVRRTLMKLSPCVVVFFIFFLDGHLSRSLLIRGFQICYGSIKADKRTRGLHLWRWMRFFTRRITNLLIRVMCKFINDRKKTSIYLMIITKIKFLCFKNKAALQHAFLACVYCMCLRF